MSTENAANAARWDVFIAACRRRGVTETRIRWYVLRIERYIRLTRTPDSCRPIFRLNLTISYSLSPIARSGLRNRALLYSEAREYKSMITAIASWHTRQKRSLRSNIRHCIAER